ncbi:tetratricopeptide repeat protein 27 [Pseudoscourfieldia marina]
MAAMPITADALLSLPTICASATSPPPYAPDFVHACLAATGELAVHIETLRRHAAASSASAAAASEPPATSSQQDTLLTTAVDLLQQFIKANLGGDARALAGTESTTTYTRDKEAIDAAAVDGEDCHGAVRDLRKLLVARCIFSGLLDKPESDADGDNDDPLVAWWALRAALWHQRMLMTQAASLRDEADRHARTLKKHVLSQGDDASAEITCMLHLELAAHAFMHSRVDDGCAHVDAACKAIDLNVSSGGHMGKRTEHQIDEKAQLVISAIAGQKRAIEAVTRPDDDASVAVPHPDVNYVVDPNADKDVFGISNVLPRPTLSEQTPDVGAAASLPPLEQVCVVAHANKVKRSTFSDDLQLWELSSYAEKLLAESTSPPLVQSWCELTLARHEKMRGRTVERGYLRMRHIVDKRCAAESDLEPSALARRHALAHLVPFPPLHALMKELGEFELSLGMVNEAMRIFEANELYDHLITCYLMLDKKPAAEALVRSRLEDEPERALLWCILGDVTKDKTNFEKAWEVSGQRHARSQRSLARMAHAVKDYAKAAGHYELALAINPMHASGWFDLGFCYMQLSNGDGNGVDESTTVVDADATSSYVERALNAFTRCVQTEPIHGEAWNNIAILSLRQGYRARAFVALQETVKWNKESWQLWENYATVALELGKYTDALHGMTQVFKLTAPKLYSSSRSDGEGEHIKQFRFDEMIASKLVERAIAVGVGGSDEGARVNQDVALGDRERADREALFNIVGGDNNFSASPADDEDGDDDDVSALLSVADLLDDSPASGENGAGDEPFADGKDSSAAPPRKQGAVLYVTSVRKLISKVASAPGMAKAGGMHKLVAQLDAAAGDLVVAEEGWLRYIRSLGLTQWAKESESFEAYAEGVLALCRLYVQVAQTCDLDESLDEEERTKLRKKKLMAAQLHLNSTIKASADSFASTERHGELRALLDDVVSLKSIPPEL